MLRGTPARSSGGLAEAPRRSELRGQTAVNFDPNSALGTSTNEYELAQWRLDSLFADHNPTSRP